MLLIFVSYLLNVSESTDCHGTATLSVSMSVENFSVLLCGRYLGMLLGLGGGGPKLSSANGIKKLIGFASLAVK